MDLATLPVWRAARGRQAGAGLAIGTAAEFALRGQIRRDIGERGIDAAHYIEQFRAHAPFWFDGLVAGIVCRVYYPVLERFTAWTMQRIGRPHYIPSARGPVGSIHAVALGLFVEALFLAFEYWDYQIMRDLDQEEEDAMMLALLRFGKVFVMVLDQIEHENAVEEVSAEEFLPWSSVAFVFAIINYSLVPVHLRGFVGLAQFAVAHLVRDARAVLRVLDELGDEVLTPSPPPGHIHAAELRALVDRLEDDADQAGHQMMEESGVHPKVQAPPRLGVHPPARPASVLPELGGMPSSSTSSSSSSPSSSPSSSFSSSSPPSSMSSSLRDNPDITERSSWSSAIRALIPGAPASPVKFRSSWIQGLAFLDPRGMEGPRPSSSSSSSSLPSSGDEAVDEAADEVGDHSSEPGSSHPSSSRPFPTEITAGGYGLSKRWLREYLEKAARTSSIEEDVWGNPHKHHADHDARGARGARDARARTASAQDPSGAESSVPAFETDWSWVEDVDRRRMYFVNLEDEEDARDLRQFLARLGVPRADIPDEDESIEDLQGVAYAGDKSAFTHAPSSAASAAFDGSEATREAAAPMTPAVAAPLSSAGAVITGDTTPRRPVGAQPGYWDIYYQYPPANVAVPAEEGVQGEEDEEEEAEEGNDEAPGAKPKAPASSSSRAARRSAER